MAREVERVEARGGHLVPRGQARGAVQLVHARKLHLLGLELHGGREAARVRHRRLGGGRAAGERGRGPGRSHVRDVRVGVQHGVGSELQIVARKALGPLPILRLDPSPIQLRQHLARDVAHRQVDDAVRLQLVVLQEGRAQLQLVLRHGDGGRKQVAEIAAGHRCRGRACRLLLRLQTGRHRDGDDLRLSDELLLAGPLLPHERALEAALLQRVEERHAHELRGQRRGGGGAGGRHVRQRRRRGRRLSVRVRGGLRRRRQVSVGIGQLRRAHPRASICAAAVADVDPLEAVLHDIEVELGQVHEPEPVDLGAVADVQTPQLRGQIDDRLDARVVELRAFGQEEELYVRAAAGHERHGAVAGDRRRAHVDPVDAPQPVQLHVVAKERTV